MQPQPAARPGSLNCTPARQGDPDLGDAACRIFREPVLRPPPPALIFVEFSTMQTSTHAQKPQHRLRTAHTSMALMPPRPRVHCSVMPRVKANVLQVTVREQTPACAVDNAYRLPGSTAVQIPTQDLRQTAMPSLPRYDPANSRPPDALRLNAPDPAETIHSRMRRIWARGLGSVRIFSKSAPADTIAVSTTRMASALMRGRAPWTGR